MGMDYALIHIEYTIPPTLGLWFLYRPLITTLDFYRLIYLISIVVIYTIPWDAYLMKRGIWTYPESAVLGSKIWGIPSEEILFFVIHTWMTTTIYLLCNKFTFKPIFLVGGQGSEERRREYRQLKSQARFGKLILTGLMLLGGLLVMNEGKGTYLGLILLWAMPFALLLWSLAYQFLLKLPLINTLAPILIPTIYLWIIDTLALREGIWKIEDGKKLGICIWEGFDIEEAIFFFITNVMIVFGLVAFDNAVSVLEMFPSVFPDISPIPAPGLLIKGLMLNPDTYDDERIVGLQEAATRLKQKSACFYLASSVVSGRLRIELIFLYSFCRVADDLIKTSSSDLEARGWLSELQTYINMKFTLPKGSKGKELLKEKTTLHITTKFPKPIWSALQQLPIHYLSEKPLQQLLTGLQTDLEFPQPSLPKRHFPIENEAKLQEYADHVAGTIAKLCLQLVFHHTPKSSTLSHLEKYTIINAGVHMGIALQYVNIARDISVDAYMNRVYIPTTWLLKENLKPTDVVAKPHGKKIYVLRRRILNRAFEMYEQAKPALEELPAEARRPLRVAVESYMEIGRVLKEGNYEAKCEMAQVSNWRRLGVAWKALKEG